MDTQHKERREKRRERGSGRAGKGSSLAAGDVLRRLVVTEKTNVSDLCKDIESLLEIFAGVSGTHADASARQQEISGGVACNHDGDLLASLVGVSISKKSTKRDDEEMERVCKRFFRGKGARMLTSWLAR